MFSCFYYRMTLSTWFHSVSGYLTCINKVHVNSGITRIKVTSWTVTLLLLFERSQTSYQKATKEPFFF